MLIGLGAVGVLGLGPLLAGLVGYLYGRSMVQSVLPMVAEEQRAMLLEQGMREAAVPLWFGGGSSLLLLLGVVLALLLVPKRGRSRPLRSRSSSIQTEVSTRTTTAQIPRCLVIEVIDQLDPASQIGEVLPPPVMHELEQREVDDLPLRSGSGQGERFLDQLVVQHHVRAHHTSMHPAAARAEPSLVYPDVYRVYGQERSSWWVMVVDLLLFLEQRGRPLGLLPRPGGGSPGWLTAPPACVVLLRALQHRADPLEESGKEEVMSKIRFFTGLLAVLALLAVGCKIVEEPKAPVAPAPVAAAPKPVETGLEIGTTVAAPWGGGMYLGTVKAVNGDTIDVLYADDQQLRPVGRNELKIVKPGTWKVGDKVSAVWSSGKFYEGTITAEKGNGIYTVAWSDGSTPSDVEASKIMNP